MGQDPIPDHQGTIGVLRDAHNIAHFPLELKAAEAGLLFITESCVGDQ